MLKPLPKHIRFTFTVLCIFCLGQYAIGQSSFVIDNCANPIFDGTYSDSGNLKNTAPCYLKQGSSSQTLEHNGTNWVFATYTGGTPCVSAFGPFSDYSVSVSASTSIINAPPLTSGMCGSGVTITAIIAAAIPTMTQWGLIILSILLSIFGAVALINSRSNKVAPV